VHEWRVAQLTRLGIPTPLAEAVAADVDWHQVAALVHRGCPPRLALRIVRWGKMACRARAISACGPASSRGAA